MIKFFRKIRQRLLSENKLTRYLIYAIGEIILVVIGILIALNINIWNEHQKALKKEADSLISLRSEMEASLIELGKDYEEHQFFYRSTLDVHQYIQTKPEETDSMYTDFYNMVRINYFFPKTSTYETLKSGNLELITSDSLRTLITDVYETGYQRILMKVDTRRNAGRLLFPYYQKHFRTEFVLDKYSSIWASIRNNISIPNDYEFLINDPEFETLIVEAIHGRSNANYDYERTTKMVEDCISQIEAYLNKSYSYQ